VLLPLAETSARWFGRAEECAWYPSVKHGHQHLRGDWNPLIERTANELKRRIARHGDHQHAAPVHAAAHG
jgi:hypothetical protein